VAYAIAIGAKKIVAADVAITRIMIASTTVVVAKGGINSYQALTISPLIQVFYKKIIIFLSSINYVF
jgi:hypothetical protein